MESDLQGVASQVKKLANSIAVLTTHYLEDFSSIEHRQTTINSTIQKTVVTELGLNN
jgi:hypothetical protein